MRKNIILLVISFIFLFPLKVHAATKEEVINYVNETQTIICDTSTKQMFITYQNLFQRMLNEKKLSSKELDKILKYLKEALTIAKQNSVCKQDDIDSLPSKVKEELKDKLYSAMMIVYDAPTISSNSPNNSGIIIDKNNNTVDIYQNGILYDKVGLSEKTFNYVGPNPIILTTLILLGSIFIISTLTYNLLKYKRFKFQKLICDICFSLSLITLIALPFVYCFRTQIDRFLSYTNMLKQPDENVESHKIVIDENHKIVSYPAYGNAYGRLKIDSLNIDLPIKFGDSKDILVDSVGHSSNTFFPGEGSTILLSGHNSKNILGNLKDISKGNEIVIATSYGVFTYKVDKIEIMKTSEYNKLNLSSEEETLILYTCYPFDEILYGNQRYVITSSLIKEEWS